MYTVSTFQLAQALDLPFQLWIPHCLVYIAIPAWIATFAGLRWTMRKLAIAQKGIVQ